MTQIPVINMVATGQNITRLRKQAGLSVANLQQIFGFTTPQAIYKWQHDSLWHCQHGFDSRTSSHHKVPQLSRSERWFHKPKVIGSIPVGTTKYGSVAQQRGAPDCRSGGCGFESRPSRHQYYLINTAPQSNGYDVGFSIRRREFNSRRSCQYGTLV